MLLTHANEDIRYMLDSCCHYSNHASITALNSFFYVQIAGHYTCNSKYKVKRDNYESIFLLLTKSGTGKLKYHNKEYDIDSCKIVLTNCKDPHEYYTTSKEPWDNIWIHFYGCTSLEYYQLIFKKAGPVFSISGIKDVFMHVEKVFKLINSKSLNAEINISITLMKILTDILLKVNSNTLIDLPNENNDFINLSILYMKEHLHEEISIEALANIACMSKYHYVRTFKTYMNYTPHEFLLMLRIRKAKELLISTKKSSNDISAEVGFINVSSFIKAFKRTEKMTPLEYRNIWNHQSVKIF